MRPLKLSHWLMNFTTTSAALTTALAARHFARRCHRTRREARRVKPPHRAQMKVRFCRLIIFIPVIVAAGQDAAGDAAPLPLSGSWLKAICVVHRHKTVTVANTLFAAIVGRRLTKCKNNCCTLCAICGKGKSRVLNRDLNATIKLAINVKRVTFKCNKQRCF